MPLTAYTLLSGTTQSALSQVVQIELSKGNRTLVYQPWSRGGYIWQGVGTGTISTGTVSNYFIVTSTTEANFAALITNNLPYYQPFGAPFVHNNALFQVMGVITASSVNNVPQMQVANGYVQYKYASDTTWTNLMPISAMSNSLSIGTVSSGNVSSANITGTPPSQVLNLTFQKGDTGPQGAKGDTGAQGPQGVQGDTGPQGVAGATGPQGATGATGAQGVKGDTGATGPANSLSIGTVTTGAAGSSAAATITGTAPAQVLNLTIPTGASGVSYSPQSPVSRTISVTTAYQHTDTTKPYRVTVNVRATQTITVAGTAADKLELRVGPTAAAVAAGGSGGFSVGIWESGITGIALMVGAGVQDGGSLFGDVPAGWYFQVNRLSGTAATIVSCFSQSMTA